VLSSLVADAFEPVVDIQQSERSLAAEAAFQVFVRPHDCFRKPSKFKREPYQQNGPKIVPNLNRHLLRSNCPLNARIHKRRSPRELLEALASRSSKPADVAIVR
jgi:hypothetical protein